MLALTLMFLGQIGSPEGVRLLDDAPIVIRVSPTNPTDAEVSVQQLQADIDGLKKMRPGLGPGITLLCIGLGAAAVGAVYLALGTALSLGGTGLTAFVVLIAIGFGVGLPMALIGVWILWGRLEDRKRIDDETISLKKELQRRRALPSNAPRFDLPAPQTRGPDASLILAQFD